MNKHKLADFIKTYGLLNGVAWIFLFFILRAEFNFIISIFALAAGIFASVTIYVVGEILQILHEIRLNTANHTTVAPANSPKAVINSELPKL